MIRYTFYIISFLFANVAISQQDALYTQFMYNKLGLNPAYAGNVDETTLNIIHRDQWTGFDGAPQAQALSLNLPAFQESIAFGLNLSREAIGIQQKLTVEGNFAYRFNLSTGSISMGLSSSIRQFENDFSDPRLVAFEDIDIDPAISRNKETKSVFNAGAGIYYRTNTYYFGVSIPRLIRADIDFEVQGELSSEVRHMYVMTGAAFPLKNNLKFTPQILFKLSENAPFDLDLNFGLDYNSKYYGALNIRTGGNNDSFAESIDVLFGFQLTEKLLLGVAYDYTLSDIGRYENGSIEALINYRFTKKEKQVDIVNPRFF